MNKLIKNNKNRILNKKKYIIQYYQERSQIFNKL
jgi:hypothetical protein